MNDNLDKDPSSEFGIAIGKRCMDWVNAYYGKNHVALRNTIWEKALKKGQIDDENALSPQTFAWLDNAITAYYRDRILHIFSQVPTLPHQVLLKQWKELLIDMQGNEQEPKNDIFNIIMKDPEISQAAKKWFKVYIREYPYAK